MKQGKNSLQEILGRLSEAVEVSRSAELFLQRILSSNVRNSPQDINFKNNSLFRLQTGYYASRKNILVSLAVRC
jgi:hypothetical protein